MQYKNINVNYKFYGDKENVIVFLHGWGGSIESFNYLSSKLNSSFGRLFIDFPPFGESQEPKEPWGVEEYAGLLKEILDAEKIKKIYIISHSFGGRVAIYFSSRYTECVEKLVLIGSAGLKPKFSLKKKLKILVYKSAKFLGFNVVGFGSADYKMLSDNMKKTFVKVVNQDLKNHCREITAQTLIIFGENDKETPVYMAKRLNKYISGSKLIIYKNAGHFCYLDCFYEILPLLENFIGG